MVVVLAAALPPEPAPAATLTPYGFLRMDAIFDDSRMSNPQFPFWVLEEPDGAEDDSDISLHPRLTRVGVNLEPETVSDDATVSGKIEIDFQNGGSESRQLIRMRHAYLTVQRKRIEFLAGQTSDLISPLYPAANNDGSMWNAGNTGDRRPQVRFTGRRKVGDGTFRAGWAIGMPNAVNSQDLDGNGQLDGQDAAQPAFQALLELDLPAVQFGVWGHLAKDEVGADSTFTEEETFDVQLLGGHVKVPLGKRAWVQGEAFAGKNATDVRAGIGQGINVATMEEIATMGGWAELGVKATDKWTITAGASLDQPDEDDLSDGMRERNFAIYLVQHFTPMDRVKVGLEFLHWETDYKAGDTADANRVNSHVTLSF
jgi:hypothetical protein